LRTELGPGGLVVLRLLEKRAARAVDRAERAVHGAGARFSLQRSVLEALPRHLAKAVRAKRGNAWLIYALLKKHDTTPVNVVARSPNVARWSRPDSRRATHHRTSAQRKPRPGRK